VIRRSTSRRRTAEPAQRGAPGGRPPELAQRGGLALVRPSFAGRSKLTSRAAVLAIVLCAIALSLAYPVREYIAERRQIDQLQEQNTAAAMQLKYLKSQERALASPSRIEQEARDTLHMCFPDQTCYEVIAPARPHVAAPTRLATSPWYGRLWESVRKADGAPPK
jgi:cell division protein FtsL